MKVLVLAGGDSGERQVSFSSGAAVYNALRRLGHEVGAIDAADGSSLLDSNGNFQTPDQPVSSVTRGSEVLARVLKSPKYADIDVVFIALHGGSGENGAIQEMLDQAGMKYTGSDMDASATAMDKDKSKQMMASVDVPTPNWKMYLSDDSCPVDKIAGQVERHFELPIIIKPNDGGSTIGLTKVNEVAEIHPAVVLSCEQSSEVLVEDYIAGRELTVSIVDYKAYPVVEIKPLGGLYDYEAKYTKGKSEYIAPALLPDDLAAALQSAALKVYRVLGATGLARVDFILNDKNEFYCLELNTLPGLTDLSLSPMALKCAGIDFDQLIAMIIESALNRHK